MRMVLLVFFIYSIGINLQAQESIDFYSLKISLKVEAEKTIKEKIEHYLISELDSLGGWKLTEPDSADYFLQVLVSNQVDGSTQNINCYFSVLAFKKYDRYNIAIKYFEKDFIKDGEIDIIPYLSMSSHERYKALRKYMDKKLPLLFHKPNLSCVIIAETKLQEACKKIIAQFDDQYLAEQREANNIISEIFRKKKK